MLQKRPYLLIPKLIEQPNWGGDYILKMKGWTDQSYLKGKKIGQSYELFGESKLLTNISDTDDPRFIAELGYSNNNKVQNDLGLFEEKDFISLSKFFNKSPLPLIKFTQASGNSFQLHAKQDVVNPRWQPKAESWYYFEDGLLTFGIKKNIDLNEYKNTCKLIEKKMKTLSNAIKNKSISLEDAQAEAKEFIKKLNPWQYVNIHEVKKNSLVDLSSGGIHHSWEEDKQKYPAGNILYEIQQDVMDPVSTIRCFDQGKINNDGTVREIHVDDYFKYLDFDPTHNNLEKSLLTRKNNRLLTTKYYCLDILKVKDKVKDQTNNSFCHLFVRKGNAIISTDKGSVHLTQGHSCFIPSNAIEYEIKSKTQLSVILKTFIQN